MGRDHELTLLRAGVAAVHHDVVTDSMGQVPSVADCTRAVRSIKGSDHGRQVLRELRPRGLGVFYRGRPPAWMLIYIAARSGRLVWRDENSFAILRPPLGKCVVPPGGRGWSLRILGAAERQWDLVVLLVPVVLIIASAFPAGILLGGRSTLAPYIILAAIYLYVGSFMAAFVLRSIVRAMRVLDGWESRERGVARSWKEILFINWSVELWHGPVSIEMADEFVARMLISGDALKGAVLCPVSRIPLESARQEIEGFDRTLGRTGGERLLVIGSEPLREKSTEESSVKGGLGALATAILMTSVWIEPPLIAEAERASCGQSCAGRATNYWAALKWLRDSLTGGFFSSGIQAYSDRARTLPLLDLALLGVLLINIFIAFREFFKREHLFDVEVRRESKNTFDDDSEAVRLQSYSVINIINGNTVGDVIMARDITIGLRDREREKPVIDGEADGLDV